MADRTCPQVERLRDLIGPLERHRVAVLGLSFKPGTDDLRDAPALRLVRALLAEACLVRAHDPMVKEPLPGMEEICPDPYDASDRAEAVVVATEWPATQGTGASTPRWTRR